MRSAAMEAGRKLMVGHIERFNPAVAKLRELVAEGRLGSHLQSAGDAGRAAAGAHPGRRRRDRPRDPRPRCHAACARRRNRRDLRRRAALRRTRPRRTCSPASCASTASRATSRPARRQLAHAGEEARARADRRERAAASQLPDPGRLVRRVAAGAAEVGGALAPARRRRGRGDALRAAKAEPLRAELEAFCRCVLDDTPEPVSAHDGVKALAAALAMRESAADRRPGRAARDPGAPAAGGGGVIRFVIPAYNEAENIPRLLADLAPRARELGARVIVVDDGSTDGTAEAIRAQRPRHAPRGGPPHGQPRPRHRDQHGHPRRARRGLRR